MSLKDLVEERILADVGTDIDLHLKWKEAGGAELIVSRLSALISDKDKDILEQELIFEKKLFLENQKVLSDNEGISIVSKITVLSAREVELKPVIRIKEEIK